MSIWKVIAGLLGLGLLGVIAVLAYIVKGFSDGMGDAFGYPSKKPWWRR